MTEELRWAVIWLLKAPDAEGGARSPKESAQHCRAEDGAGYQGAKKRQPQPGTQTLQEDQRLSSAKGSQGT